MAEDQETEAESGPEVMLITRQFTNPFVTSDSVEIPLL